MGVNQFVCLVYVFYVSIKAMSDISEVIECVVAHLMSVIQYSLIKLRVLSYIVTDDKEGRLDTMFFQSIENKRSRFGYGTVVKGQIYRMLFGVHAPKSFRV